MEHFPSSNQKQSDLLLNADDLDAMWVCLRENCVIDDATGAEKVSDRLIVNFHFPAYPVCKYFYCGTVGVNKSYVTKTLLLQPLLHELSHQTMHYFRFLENLFY